MSEVPGTRLLTTPEVFIIATDVLTLVQVPPGVELLSVVVVPSQAAIVPVMVPGKPFTVNSTEFRQPVAVTV